MSITLNPGLIYSIRPTLASTGSTTAVQSAATVKPSAIDAPKSENDVPADHVVTLENRLNTEEFVAALREMKSHDGYLKRDLASQTYLNIAHYDGGFHLIDVYT